MATALKAAESKSFITPEETRRFDKGHLDLVTVGGQTIGRAEFLPGWKWSESIKPIAKTDSCQSSHLGYVASGAMIVVMDDGTRVTYGPGDAMSIPPGHDAWVDGTEPCVIIDFTGFEEYAKPAP